MYVSKFLDPKNDVAFKKIFGTEKNKDILIGFLNDLIFAPSMHSHIDDVEFLPTIQDPEIAASKTSIVDVLCKDNNGVSYIIEMQVSRDKSFAKRAQYYAAKAYSSQMKRGDKYEDLKAIVFLAITDFVMFPEKKDGLSCHIILDKTTYEHDLQDFSFTFMELPKYNQDKNNLQTDVEKWAYYFKSTDDLREDEVSEIFRKNNMIKRAYQEVDRFNWDKIELISYEGSLKKQRDYLSFMEQKYEDGMVKGKIEGEKSKAIDMARKLLESGVSDEIILSTSGLSKSDLDNLKKCN